MKKLINLIALVMLVSVNVLTPFSYADVEDFEPTPENNMENSVEEEWVSDNEVENSIEIWETSDNKENISDNNETSSENEEAIPENDDTIIENNETIQEDDEITPENDGITPDNDEIVLENEEISPENDEKTVENETNSENDEMENDENLELQQVQESTTMGVISWTSVTLLSWKDFNVAIKKLAWQSSATYSYKNTTINQIIYTWTIPWWVNTTWLSISWSDYPVYGWFTGWIVYYTTEAETIYINPDSSYMFYYMQWLTWLDVSRWNTSNVTSMRSMFNQCSNLKWLDVSRWNTSNVTNMRCMFQNCSSLTWLEISNWNTSSVTDMSYLFNECSSLTWLEISNWNTSSVTDMSYLFNECSSLMSLEISNWNTSSVTNMSSMFSGCISLENLDIGNWNTSSVTGMNSLFSKCNNLKSLDLSKWDTSSVTNMATMFYDCSNLEVIYAGTWFVTNSVTGHGNMFFNNRKLAWWNGTKFDSLKTNKELARIDKEWEAWYFTNRDIDILVKFVVWTGIYETQMVQYWGKAIRPVNNPMETGLQFNWWYGANWEEYDFETEKINKYTEIYGRFSGSNGTTLLLWQEFNQTIKRLAWDDSATYSTINTWIKQIIQVQSIPEWVMTWIISSPYSDNEVVARFTGWILFYYTDADTIYMNPDSSYMFYNMHWLTSLDISNWNTSSVRDMSSIFFNCNSLISLDLSNFDTSSVTNMSSMFANCSGLLSLDLSSFNTSKVTNMNEMFRNCSKLTSLDVSKFDISNVTSMATMFTSCTNLEEVNLSGWDFTKVSNKSLMNNIGLTYTPLKKLDLTNTKFSWDMFNAFGNLNKLLEIKLDWMDISKVTNMSYTFSWLESLTELDLSHLDTSNVTDIHEIFENNTQLRKIDLSNWNTSNITNMGYIFYYSSNLEEINLSGWDFSKVSNDHLVSHWWWLSKLKKINMTNAKFSWSMEDAFEGLQSLEMVILDGADTSNVTDMRGMFSWSDRLTELDLSSFDTSNVTDMSYMFNYCTGLTQVNLSSFDTSNVTKMDSMFNSCSSITWLDLSNFNTRNLTGMFSMFYCNKLEELNLSWWDLRKVRLDGWKSYVSLWSSVKKLNMTNVKFSWSMNYAFSYECNLEELILDWVNTRNVTGMYEMFYNCRNLTSLDLSSFNTSNVTSMSEMFYNCNNLKTIYVWSRFRTNNVTSSSYMFYGDTSIVWWNWTTYNSWIIDKTYAVIDKIGTPWYFTQSGNNDIKIAYLLPWISFNTTIKSLAKTTTVSNYTDEDTLITKIEKAEIIPAWVTTGVISTMDSDVPIYAWFTWWIIYYYTTAEVIEMDSNSSNMFYNLKSIKDLDITMWDVSNVTNMQNMFVSCISLKNLNLDGWNLSDAPNMGGMLGNTPSLKTMSMSGWKIPESFTHWLWRSWWWYSSPVEEIDVTNRDLSLAKNLYGLFWDCRALKTINWLETWDTSNVTDMGNMFYWCINLTWLDLSNWDTSNVANISAMFQNCSGLQNLDLSNWDLRKLTSYGSVISNTPNLTNISMRWWKIPESFINVIWRTWWYSNNTLEEIDVSNWDLSKTKDIQWLFWDSKALKIIKWLDTWDTSNVTNMSQMFLNCNNLTNLDLSNWNTSNVTGMDYMFLNCNSLTWLDLSNFDTMHITNMNQMFLNCSGLAELDLSSFDTSNVTNMGQMFFNTPNLKTIYASEKFVTTALSWDTSSKDMFSWTITVVWWNGTKFDSWYTDKTYALIDKVWQTWYFTDKNAITVKFINTLDWTESTKTFAKWQKLTPSTVDGYHVVWWYLDEAMTQPIDLNKWVDSYSEIYVKYERNGSSGWWGWWGWGGWSTKPDTPKEDNTPTDTSEQTVQNDEQNTQDSSEQVPQNDEQSKQDFAEQTPQNDNNNTKPSEWQSDTQKWRSFSQEFQQAYEFAHENGITTKSTVQDAKMYGNLTRIAMAKMLSQYAVNVLWKEPDLSKWTVKFNDVSNKMDKDYDNGVTLAYQLWIMWQNMTSNNFRPNDEVTRAEFATALSRLLYSTSDGEYKSTAKYYINHMNKLKKEWIITNTDPKMKELRGYVMIMLMRSAR